MENAAWAAWNHLVQRFQRHRSLVSISRSCFFQTDGWEDLHPPTILGSNTNSLNCTGLVLCRYMRLQAILLKVDNLHRWRCVKSYKNPVSLGQSTTLNWLARCQLWTSLPVTVRHSHQVILCDLLIPYSWRSRFALERRSLNHPKKGTKNCQAGMFSWLLFTSNLWCWKSSRLSPGCVLWLFGDFVEFYWLINEINEINQSIHEIKAKNEEASICWQCFVFHPCILLRLGFKQLIYYHKMSCQKYPKMFRHPGLCSTLDA